MTHSGNSSSIRLKLIMLPFGIFLLFSVAVAAAIYFLPAMFPGIDLQLTLGWITLQAIILLISLHLCNKRLIIEPLARLSAAAEKIASGDLNTRIPVVGNDELALLSQSINTMAGNFHQTVSEMGSITHTITTITHDVVQTSSSVSSSADKQAAEIRIAQQASQDIDLLIKSIIASIDQLALTTSASRSSIIEMITSISSVAENSETLAESVSNVSSSISEIIAAIHEVNSNVDTLNLTAGSTATSATQLAASIVEVEASAQHISRVSEKVQQDARTGQEAVKASLQGIQKIKASSDITFDVISTLSDRVADIGSILSVIEEVTEQTELLSLNAAIIAAQAGEHGKGFAVVADEIKELAERTNSSTREISKVIQGVQDETVRAVTAIQQAESTIDVGIDLANRSGSALEQIYLGVEQTVSQMREITRATTEQAKSSQTISSAMIGVSQLVQQIARATEEQSNGGHLILAATEEMKSLTENVLQSTREQHRGSRHLSDAVENIGQQMQKITGDCSREQERSQKMIAAMELVRQNSAANLEASQKLDQTVGTLQQQITNLGSKIKLQTF